MNTVIFYDGYCSNTIVVWKITTYSEKCVLTSSYILRGPQIFAKSYFELIWAWIHFFLLDIDPWVYNLNLRSKVMLVTLYFIKLKNPDNDIDSETLNPDFKGKYVYYWYGPFLCRQWKYTFRFLLGIRTRPILYTIWIFFLIESMISTGQSQ